MEEHIKQAKHQIQLCDIVEPLLEWYRKNARRLPWRENTDPYRVWVSEIMLQQTRVEAVKPYFERFLKQLPTLKDLAAADEDTLLKLWEGLGYYARVRNLQKAAQTICKEYGGIFPETYEETSGSRELARIPQVQFRQFHSRNRCRQSMETYCASLPV